jgi:hypothetical protein
MQIMMKAKVDLVPRCSFSAQPRVQAGIQLGRGQFRVSYLKIILNSALVTMHKV